jgi:hypothetical protein
MPRRLSGRTAGVVDRIRPLHQIRRGAILASMPGEGTEGASLMQAAEEHRFRLSVRTLMIAVAVCALLLAPLIWLMRQNALLRSQQMRAVEAERMARAAAERAVYASLIRSAQAQVVSKASYADDHPEEGSPVPKRGGLWVALGVNHVVFRRGDAKGLDVEFSLVNDSEETIDPKIAESRIVVNGKELVDSGLILGNGPRDARFAALPPGEHLQFGYSLGDYFKEPGVYRVSWRGANFRSPEVVFRVLPEKTD